MMVGCVEGNCSIILWLFLSFGGPVSLGCDFHKYLLAFFSPSPYVRQEGWGAWGCGWSYIIVLPLIMLSSNIFSLGVLILAVENTLGIFCLFSSSSAQNVRAFLLDLKHENLVGFLQVTSTKIWTISQASPHSVSVNSSKWPHVFLPVYDSRGSQVSWYRLLITVFACLSRVLVVIFPLTSNFWWV